MKKIIQLSIFILVSALSLLIAKNQRPDIIGVGRIFHQIINHDSSQVVISGSNGNLFILDVNTFKLIDTIIGRNTSSLSLAYYQKGDFLASGFNDGYIEIYNLGDRKIFNEIQSTSTDISKLDFYNDSIIVSCSRRDSVFQFWNIKNSILMKQIKINNNGNFLINHNNNTMIIGTYDSLIFILDLTNYNIIDSIFIRVDYTENYLIDESGELVFTGVRDSSYQIFNYNFDMYNISSSKTFSGNISTFDPTKKFIAGSNNVDCVSIWSYDSLKIIYYHKLNLRFGWAGQVMFLPDNKTILCFGYEDIIKINYENNSESDSLFCNADQINTITFSPDDKFILAGYMSSGIYAFNVQYKDTLFCLKEEKQKYSFHSVNDIVFHPNGKYFLTANYDGTLKMWDFQNQEMIMKYSRHNLNAESCDFSPDGNKIVSGGLDEKIKIWETVTGKEIAELSEHYHYVNTVDYHPFDDKIISGSTDGTIRLWDANSFIEIKEARVCDYGWGNYCVKYNKDATLIARCGEDGKPLVIDPNTLKVIKALLWHKERSRSLDFHPIKNILASSDCDGNICLWNLDDFSLIKTFKAYTGWIYSIVFSHDGKMLAVGCSDGTIRIWDTETLITDVSSEKKDTYGLKIYPNPATNILNLYFKNKLLTDISQINIYSGLGNELELPFPDINGNQVQLDISSLPQGVYFINVSINGTIERSKFVKF